jgi:hypothetical protein
MRRWRRLAMCRLIRIMGGVDSFCLVNPFPRRRQRVCRVLFSGRASAACKASANTVSKAEIDRGCKGSQEDSESRSACLWGEEEAKEGPKGNLLVFHLQLAVSA